MCGNGQGNGMMGINGQGGGPNMGMPPQGNVQQGPMQMPPQMGQMPMMGFRGQGGGPNMQPQMGQMPPQMGQFPPRQAMGGPMPPMGQPMTDPTSAGGNFAPQGQWSHYLAMLRGGRQ